MLYILFIFNHFILISISVQFVFVFHFLTYLCNKMHKLYNNYMSVLTLYICKFMMADHDKWSKHTTPHIHEHQKIILQKKRKNEKQIKCN